MPACKIVESVYYTILSADVLVCISVSLDSQNLIDQAIKHDYETVVLDNEQHWKLNTVDL